MRKLHLAALSYERDAVLDALQSTFSVELGAHEETEGTSPVAEDCEELRAEFASLEAASDILTAAAQRHAKERKPLADAFSVSYSEFMAAGELKDKVHALVGEINARSDEKSAALAEQAQLLRALAAAEPYEEAELPFSAYRGTAHVGIALGLLPFAAWEGVKGALEALGLVACEAKRTGENILLAYAAHNAVAAEAEKLLSEAGFTACPYTQNETGKMQAERLRARLAEAKAEEERAERALFELTDRARELKIYCDFVDYRLEKAEAAAKLRGTERTFLLEGYVPADDEEKVKEALGKFEAVYYEFSDPAEGEFVPTLMKNNVVVRNFETITNMYSVPDPHELDPNTVMSFFYSVFLGFIMGDIGYGLIMLLGGAFLWHKNRRREGGIKSLSGVFAVGGIFAIFWGFMFNSLLGIRVLPFTVMPDPQTEMYNFIGIDIPSVLVISLMLGVVQLMAGYLCRMVQEWREGRPLDGIFDGGVWAVFSLGVELALIGLVKEFELSFLATAGGIVAGAMLLVAVLTAGRHEKFLGKLTKGFSSVYGLINYFTDVLSYIRLYGLMLTGAVIAQVISQYAVSFMTSGSVLIVLGVVLMVIGHVFNLAIGLLGAYIHDARLQYVEFFGRFYRGEGKLFTPLGTVRRHIVLEAPAA